MTEQEKQLGVWLSQIADELNITDTMLDRAVSSYGAVGKWLSDGIALDVSIEPQGSVSLGTVIRPISDKDEYDIDLVCLLKNGRGLPLYYIKSLVGDRLKAHGTYQHMLEPEGKRCWTMQYEEFHMDILPCVPKEMYYMEPHLTSIMLTHKNEQGHYEPRFSNPHAYRIWFEDRMKDVLRVEKGHYAARNNIDIAAVPTYRVRTPLQKAIQLMKRHRDILFQHNDENAPISIIITTLAARAYNGEDNVYEALRNIVAKMPLFIERRHDGYWVENPVMSEENFADKWNETPAKATAFYQWLRQLKHDLLTAPLACYGQDNLANHYMGVFGKQPVERAVKALAHNTRSVRQNNNLHMNGLTGGLTTTPTAASKPVRDHIFYGK